MLFSALPKHVFPPARPPARSPARPPSSVLGSVLCSLFSCLLSLVSCMLTLRSLLFSLSSCLCPVSSVLYPLSRGSVSFDTTCTIYFSLLLSPLLSARADFKARRRTASIDAARSSLLLSPSFSLSSLLLFLRPEAERRAADDRGRGQLRAANGQGGGQQRLPER